MPSFLKMFLASLLAFFIFMLLVVFFFVALAGALAAGDKPTVAEKSILVLDLSTPYPEHPVPGNITSLGEDEDPSLHHVIRMLEKAANDKKVSTLYIKADGNANGFAASAEIRNAILQFRKSKKKVIAYGDIMTENAFFIASAADRVYVNPAGLFEWTGYSVNLPFLKGTLEKLGIEAQIFYAGKYKSATEIFRVDKMTPENRLQTQDWLSDIYAYHLQQVASSRGMDTATLASLANNGTIQTPADAVKSRLIDGVKYDDEVKAEIKKDLGIEKYGKMNMVSMETYFKAASKSSKGSDRVAVIYASGDIVDGEGTDTNIGGDNFRSMIRKARLDKSVKAIVLRVNSGGGSALASENIWRELRQAKADGKPVVVSFGDVAASGGYYIAAGADSIFAHPNTITGSIGVFGVLPNMQGFFKDKLGMTFDGVKTGPFADVGSVTRPLTEAEGRVIQAGVDRIYQQFKTRVAEGRKLSMATVDSIAQGRVWSGYDARRIGLVDRFGSLQDAINCAAGMAKLKEYGFREFPQAKSWLNQIFDKDKETPEAMIKSQLGQQNYEVYRQLMRIREMSGSVQARLPYEFMFK